MPRAAISVLLTAVLAIAACSSSVQSAPPTESAAGTPTPVPQATALLTDEPLRTAEAGQVDTEWGPIWETLPAGFPTVAGAQLAEADTVVSAAYTVPTSSIPNARAVADDYARRFADVGYGGTVDGPFEDGSYTTWASNGYGCDILVTAVPRGREEVYVTVLYGALCPFQWAG